jgi:hypothetical protein
MLTRSDIIAILEIVDQYLEENGLEDDFLSENVWLVEKIFSEAHDRKGAILQ